MDATSRRRRLGVVARASASRLGLSISTGRLGAAARPFDILSTGRVSSQGIKTPNQQSAILQQLGVFGV
jgi:hypothetical protein